MTVAAATSKTWTYFEERWHEDNVPVTVIEMILTYQELELAEEILSTGNYPKVVPINRIDGQFLHPGPIYTKARELYWSFAHS